MADLATEMGIIEAWMQQHGGQVLRWDELDQQLKTRHPGRMVEARLERHAGGDQLTDDRLKRECQRLHESLGRPHAFVGATSSEQDEAVLVIHMGLLS